METNQFYQHNVHFAVTICCGLSFHSRASADLATQKRWNGPQGGSYSGGLKSLLDRQIPNPPSRSRLLSNIIDFSALFPPNDVWTHPDHLPTMASSCSEGINAIFCEYESAVTLPAQFNAVNGVFCLPLDVISSFLICLSRPIVDILAHVSQATQRPQSLW